MSTPPPPMYKPFLMLWRDSSVWLSGPTETPDVITLRRVERDELRQSHPRLSRALERRPSTPCVIEAAEWWQ